MLPLSVKESDPFIEEIWDEIFVKKRYENICSSLVLGHKHVFEKL